MKFFKKIGEVLLGSSKAKKIVKSKARPASKRVLKPGRKKAVKSSKKKVSKKVSGKSKPQSGKAKSSSKKQPALIRSALAAIPAAEVTHYFPHVNAAVLKIKTGVIRLGDELQFKGHTTDFRQKVVSMQIDHKPVLIAKRGDDFGVEVKSRVRAGDLVFKK